MGMSEKEKAKCGPECDICNPEKSLFKLEKIIEQAEDYELYFNASELLLKKPKKKKRLKDG